MSIRNSLINYLIITLWITSTCRGEGNITDLINAVFKNGYDRKLRPHFSDPDLTIDVSLSLARTLDLSEENMALTAELYLYQRWHDDRLTFSESISDYGENVIGGHELSNYAWDPKTYLPMSKIERNDKSDTYFKLSSNGTIIMVSRLFVSLPCNHLKRNNEPSMDMLECQIKIASFVYGGQRGGVRYSWVSGGKAITTIPTRLDYKDFRFVTEVLDQELDSSYRSLSARILFRRRVGIICRLVVLPSLICVGVAVLSMYVPSKFCGARMALSTIALLFATSILMLSASRSDRMTSMTFMDRFLYGCLFAVGLTMIDHLLVTYRVVMNRKSRSKNIEVRDPRNIPGQPYRMVPKHTDHQRLLLQCTTTEPSDCRSRWRKCTSCLRQSVTWTLAILDWLLRLAVPAFFVVFVLHYRRHLFDETRFEPKPDPIYLVEEMSYGVPANHWI